MNRIAVVVAVVVSSMQLGYAVICKKGTVEWKGGCAATDSSGAEWSSSEKPPQKRSPAWERGEVNAMVGIAAPEKRPAPIQVSSDVGKEAK